MSVLMGLFLSIATLVSTVTLFVIISIMILCAVFSDGDAFRSPENPLGSLGACLILLIASYAISIMTHLLLFATIVGRWLQDCVGGIMIALFALAILLFVGLIVGKIMDGGDSSSSGFRGGGSGGSRGGDDFPYHLPSSF